MEEPRRRLRPFVRHFSAPSFSVFSFRSSVFVWFVPCHLRKGRGRPRGSEMNKNNATCDHESLELLLCDKLGDDQREALESHLDECASCRDRLEKLAAEPSLWAEAHEALSSADDDRGFASSSGAGEGSSVLSRSDAYVARA